MTGEQGGDLSRRADYGILVSAGALAAVSGPLMAAAGERVLPAVMAVPLALAVALQPQRGAYLYLLATPLIVGIARGATMPILRPNEALLLLVGGALAARLLWLILRGDSYRPVFTRIDLALVFMAASSSLLPLTLRFARGLPISADDVLYALVLWKYWIVYRIFHEAVATPAQVAACLWLSMASASAVAVIAILQVNDLLGVPQLLATYYDDPFAGVEGPVVQRATSTVALSFGVANLMAINLAIAVAWLPSRPAGWPLLVGAALIFLLGSIAAGQFSGFIGLLVAVLAVGIITGRLSRVLALALPAGAAAALLFAHVITARLEGFAGRAGLPQSWLGRLDNMQRFIWPELFAGVNWITGVRPAARLPAPESWREWVFIESGYVWLLWTGGLPLLAAFIYFAWVGLRDLAHLVRARRDPIGVAAAASFAGLAMIAVLMVLDPHLTMRGSADLFFPLLALAFVGERRP